ncbi:MAG: hypothetical protein JWL84_1513 [Rhodospirillales bacterium]|nr:hypothetical protein [Rhodospirillales bacterium]
MSKKSKTDASEGLIAVCQRWHEMRAETQAAFKAARELKGKEYDAALAIAEQALERQNSLFKVIWLIVPETPQALIAQVVVARTELADDNSDCDGKVTFADSLHDGLHQILCHAERLTAAAPASTTLIDADQLIANSPLARVIDAYNRARRAEGDALEGLERAQWKRRDGLPHGDIDALSQVHDARRAEAGRLYEVIESSDATNHGDVIAKLRFFSQCYGDSADGDAVVFWCKSIEEDVVRLASAGQPGVLAPERFVPSIAAE